SSPGEATIKDTEQYGGTFRMPLTSSLSLAAKGDQKIEGQGLETRALELDVRYKLTEKWTISTGVRNDLRKDHSPVAPLTQIQGERTDAVAQVKFDSSASWSAYGFGQHTVAASGGREDNDRIGVGGSYRLTKRFRIDGEASDGHLGPGGKVGTSLLYSERTSLYLNYSLENERTDNGQLLRGSQGNLVSGAKTRLSDTSSVYVEERYQNGASLSGLTHTTGINLTAKERWNFGGSGEFGKLRDSNTEAVVGYAYRPVRNDRLNALVKYTYFYNVPTTGQVGLQNTAAEFLQKSHIAALDLTYDLTANWSLGGKYAYRLGQESLDRVHP